MRFFLARGVLLIGASLSTIAACKSSDPGSDPCTDDQNGVIGGSQTILLTVSDTAFTVGSPDAGPGEPNITVENSATVKLTLTNVGTKPHDFVVECLATPNDNGCPATSCFPAAANIAAVAPGRSATTTFVTPFPEGAYTFTSDVAGDTQTDADGGVSGLVGQFVLM